MDDHCVWFRVGSAHTLAPLSLYAGSVPAIPVAISMCVKCAPRRSIRYHPQPYSTHRYKWCRPARVQCLVEHVCNDREP